MDLLDRPRGHESLERLAFADPESGLSFAWLTNGLDRHLLRPWRRTSSIASKAGLAGGSGNAAG